MFAQLRLCLLCLLLGVTLPASAIPGAVHRTEAVETRGASQLALRSPGARQGQASSAAEAAKIAKQRYGGKILKVKTVRTDDGVLYRVKILLDNGRVRTVVISG